MNNSNDRNLTHTPHTAEADEFASLRPLLDDLRESAQAAAGYHRERAIIAPASHRVHRMAWALASLLLTIGIATPFALHKNHVTAQVAAPTAVVPTTTSTPISDDALLADIQDDLTASVPTPMLPLTTTTSTSTQLTTTQRNSQ
jgi:hypothetical protein